MENETRPSVYRYSVNQSGKLIYDASGTYPIAVGGNMFHDFLPEFLHPAYKRQIDHVTLEKPKISGIVLTEGNKQDQLRWTICNRSFDGSLISSQCRDIKLMRDSLPETSLVHIICSRIESRFFEPLKLENLLDKVKVSRMTIHRKFIQSIGVSVIDYLTLTRLWHAVDMMRTSQKSLTSVALECGFCDHSYLTKKCREFTSLAPTNFLKSTEQPITF